MDTKVVITKKFNWLQKDQYKLRVALHMQWKIGLKQWGTLFSWYSCQCTSLHTHTLPHTHTHTHTLPHSLPLSHFCYYHRPHTTTLRSKQCYTDPSVLGTMPQTSRRTLSCWAAPSTQAGAADTSCRSVEDLKWPVAAGKQVCSTQFETQTAHNHN